MLEFAQEDPDVMYLSGTGFESKTIPRLMEGQYVYIGSQLTFRQYKKKYCQLTIAKERLGSDVLAIHLQKNSTLTADFDLV